MPGLAPSAGLLIVGDEILSAKVCEEFFDCLAGFIVCNVVTETETGQWPSDELPYFARSQAPVCRAHIAHNYLPLARCWRLLFVAM